MCLGWRSSLTVSPQTITERPSAKILEALDKQIDDGVFVPLVVRLAVWTLPAVLQLEFDVLDMANAAQL